MDCPEPSCQTPEYPYSPGEMVEDAKPGVSTAAAEVEERILDPWGFTVAAHKPGEQFGIKVAIKVYLTGASPVQERHKVAGWLEKHLGESEHEVESVTPSEFIVRSQRFLRASRIEDVLMVSVNGVPIERADDKNAPVRDNLDSMVSGGVSSISSSKKRVDSVVVEAFGTSDQFELQMQLQFRPVHPKKSQGVTLYLWALPHELMKRNDESEFFYEDRINQVIDDKVAIKKLELESRARMETTASVFEAYLMQQFPVERTSHEIAVDLHDITA